MAIKSFGEKAKFGIEEGLNISGYFVQSAESKRSWEVKTFMGANGVEKGGVKYKEKCEVSISLIGAAAPSEDVAKTIIDALGYAGAVAITEISEARKAEEFTEWSISATVFPDMDSSE